ncbi:MAG: Ca-activated chloride channel family protein [Pseudohongiellaceae bacterium]|jgi:Ca-activated chloride channel family protein
MFKLRRYPKREVLVDYPYGYTAKKPSFWRLFLFLLLTVLISTVAWYASAEETLLEQPLSEALGPGQWRLSDVKAGQLLYKKKGEVLFHNATVLNSEVHFTLHGLMAKAELSQQFKNQSDDWVEAVYVFPLPEKAAVHLMQIKIADRIIEGTIKEKQQAKKIYQAAKKAGKKAGIIEQQRPNMFTVKVANIAPHETIDVNLEYTQTIAYQQGRFSLRFPMTITPRYIPGAPLKDISPLDETMNEKNIVMKPGIGWAFDTKQVPDASHITPMLNPVAASGHHVVNPIKITADINMAMPLDHIDSAYHNIILSRQDNRYHLRLSNDVVSMNQDFVLSWTPDIGMEPKAALFSETVAGDEYHLFMLLPPNIQYAKSAMPKEVIYIVDTSGSMGGVSIRQAKKSLLLALKKLKPDDYFNIIEFNSQHYPLYSQAVVADAHAIHKAEKFVNNLQSRGGTNMLPALQFALNHQEHTGRVRQVIFITDGAVGNEEALFKAIHHQLGSSRLFTVGIGSAPNHYFMRKAAEFGRGSFTYIGNINEVNEKMTSLFSQLDSPVMKDITITWPEGVSVEAYPQKIPDLYQGEPLLVNIKTNHLQGDIKVSGKIRDKTWHKTISLSQEKSQKDISKLWAREKISSLMDEKVKGRDEASVKRDVLSVSLSHQIMSAYTSFVAVDKQVSREITEALKTSPVLNARPKGQAPQTFAYPNTATRSQQSLYLSLLFLLLAGLWCVPGMHRQGEY